VNANKKNIDILGSFNRGNLLDLLYVRLSCSFKLLPVVPGYFMFSDMGWTLPPSPTLLNFRVLLFGGCTSYIVPNSDVISYADLFLSEGVEIISRLIHQMHL
jgi:hypothetical protein